jgi:hypothetical protein
MFPTEHARKSIEMHFRHRNLAWTEEYFVDVLRTSDKKGDLNCACWGLREVGTLRAVEFIKPHAHHRVPDVRMVAFETIVHIARSEESAWYGRMLLEAGSPISSKTLATISVVADQRALPAMLQHFHALLSAAGTQRIRPGTLAFGRNYFERCTDRSDSCRSVLEQLNAAWNALPEEEQRRASRAVKQYRPL